MSDAHTHLRALDNESSNCTENPFSQSASGSNNQQHYRSYEPGGLGAPAFHHEQRNELEQTIDYHALEVICALLALAYLLY